MRSQLVYSAGANVPNRFLLTTIVMRAVRTLHIDFTRTEDTANQVLADVASGRYVDAKAPAAESDAADAPVLRTQAA